MTQICRIEHKDSGLGPYQHFAAGELERLGKQNGCLDPFCGFRCPPPFAERELARAYMKDDGKWRFGFADLDQMAKWFPGRWLEVLAWHGFHIVVLEMWAAPLTLKTSASQAMYQTKHARKMGVMELI